MKISLIKPNKANPRTIKDAKFHKLCESIKQFPKMMELRPIVIDNDGTILGGNMRFKAICELGYKDIPDTWVVKADSLTDEEKQRFIIDDNVGFGEWDFEALANEWDDVQLQDWGVDIPNFENENNNLDEKKDLSDNIELEYKVEVTCGNEKQQEQLYNKLILDGYECRIASLKKR